MALSAMELQLGVLGFLPTAHAETNLNKMRPQSLRNLRRFTRVYIHTQAAVHMRLTNHGYFDRGKSPNVPLEPHARIKMAQVLGSRVYICDSNSNTFFCNESSLI